eukprot:4959810-Amphidinium_carterae.5
MQLRHPVPPPQGYAENVTLDQAIIKQTIHANHVEHLENINCPNHLPRNCCRMVGGVWRLATSTKEARASRLTRLRFPHPPTHAPTAGTEPF